MLPSQEASVMLHVIHEIHDDPHGGSWDINGKNAIPAKPSNLSLSLQKYIKLPQNHPNGIKITILA